MSMPPVVSPEEWLTARKALLVKEKEFTDARDALSARRRELPMTEVDKDYVFEGQSGEVRLLDLFEGRRQLIIYHFMWLFERGEGCPSCSFVLDNFGHPAHLHARDTSFAVVSRGPLADTIAFRDRMGWDVPWFSSYGSDFNFDFNVSIDPAVAPPVYNYRPFDADGPGEGPGLSAFLRDGERIFHTYSTFARGLDALVGTYQYLDLTAYGRQEEFEKSPSGWPQSPSMAWLRHHDKYAENP